MNSQSKFLHRVRIHDGECGALARAMHHEGNESATLITKPISGTSRDRLFERKQMSTKTLKRLALVAVSALGFGLMAVTPSNSAGVSDSLTGGATSSTSVLTAATNPLVLSFIADGGSSAMTLTGTVMSSPITSSASTVSFSATAGATQVNTTAPGASVVPNTASIRTTGYVTASFTPDVAGTYVIKITSAGGVNNQSITWTVTASAQTFAGAKAFISHVTGSPATADSTATQLTFDASANVTAKARLTVTQYSDAALTTLSTQTTAQTAVVVSIDKGLVASTNNYTSGSSSATVAAGTANTSDFYIFANGSVGTATVTVSVNGAVLGTKTVYFSGAATKLSVALKAGNKTYIAPTQTTIITASPLDVNGNAAANAAGVTITATSSSTAVATVSVSGKDVTITGVAAGTATITVADAAATASSATYVVTVVPVVSATAPTLTFDKASYLPGELMTITVGAAAADNASFAAFSANPVASTTLVTVTNPFTSGAVALVGGKATWTAYAPLVPGTLSVTGAIGAGSSATGSVTASAVIEGGALADAANAAADAALEAIDAANAATDAANLAAEAADAATVAAEEARDAADAATAAVEALAAQVAEMIADLKTQLTALANTVAKIAKKVKA